MFHFLSPNCLTQLWIYKELHLNNRLKVIENCINNENKLLLQCSNPEEDILQELFLLFLALVFPKLWLLQHEVVQMYIAGEKKIYSWYYLVLCITLSSDIYYLLFPWVELPGKAPNSPVQINRNWVNTDL